MCVCGFRFGCTDPGNVAHRSKWFRSELVSAALQYGGFDVNFMNRVPCSFSPNSLYKTLKDSFMTDAPPGLILDNENDPFVTASM